MNKTFYWLKIKKDFFNSILIKKMRKSENGNAMAIVYLKMQLEAVENEGIIPFLGYGEDIVEEISLNIDEEISIVKNTLDFLAKYGMASLEETQLFLPETLKNTEKETDAAERMRRMRERREGDKNV